MVQPTGLPSGVTAQDVERQLNRILESAVFQRSERLRRFLRYATEEGLAGGANRVTEYAIALQVFDKPEDFDSRNDPVVRVEAGRLRAKIREYYATTGTNDGLFVGIRDRGYMPIIRKRVPEKTAREKEEPVKNSKPCVAVLTFEDLSMEGSPERLCEALTHGIVHGLTKERDVKVLSRALSTRLRAGSEDFRERVTEFAVDYIVEGSVQRHENQARILVELSDTKTGQSQWSRSMDHPLNDVLLLQEVVAREILKGLRKFLRLEGLAEPSRQEEHNVALSKGYAHFVRGKKAWESGAVKDLKDSLENFERAGRLDPDFAAAWAGLANARIALALTRTTPPGSLMREAKTAALRALVVDRNSAEAHAAMGVAEAWCEFDWDAAEAAFDTARALDSDLALIDQWHALTILLPHGKIAEARRLIEQAQRAEPTSILLHYYRGVLEYLQGNYADSARILETVVELEPGYESAHLTLGDAYLFSDREREAMEQYARVREIAGDSPSCWRSAEAFAHATNGRRSEAKRLLKRLLRASDGGYSWPYEVAIVYAALGEEQAALEWLERAREDGVLTLAWLLYEPKLRGLRKHPDFTKLLSRLGLRDRYDQEDSTLDLIEAGESRG